MKLLIICCGVLKDELEYISKKVKTNFDILIVPEHLHLEPEKLKIEIQKLLDETIKEPTINEDTNGYDFVVLAFGLCGGALNGIKTNKHTVIVPKAHDCITFFLGSKEKFNRLFNEYGGKAYWFTKCFLKQGFLPTKENLENKRLEYMQKFDEDSASYLIETENTSFSNYNTCAMIDDLKNPSKELKDSVNSCSLEFNWNIIKHCFNDELFSKIVSGKYNEKEFLVVPPYKTIRQSDNEEIITYE